ncbi:MAG TPA: hypothetical protein VGE41_02685, partial [Verrucomicrobiae bacterium]
GINGANGDPDGDGFTNLQEYQAGTDPHDASSNLRLVIVNLNPGVKLSFTAQPNLSYTVEYTDALGTSWTRLIDFSPSASQTAWEVTDSSGPAHRFYRVRTPKLP